MQGHQSEAHDSGREVDTAQLAALGIKYFRFETVEEVDKLALERHYKNRDVVNIAPTTLPNYEEKIKAFFSEHIHEDEEIRYILDGSGFFDVRNAGDEWVRIALEQYDLIIMPAGIYHRFTTDTKNVRSRCLAGGYTCDL
jgi:1,2-dihydroxy-3-keto-5-methylthiopentene dioxygenase